MVIHDVEASDSTEARDEATTSRSQMMRRRDRGGRGRPFAPALDVREGEDGFTLYVELAGVAADDVDITLEDNVLTVSGERSTRDEVDEGTYRRVERSHGRFHRAVRLPARIAGDDVTARFTDGILTIEVPKSHEARPRRVPVEGS